MNLGHACESGSCMWLDQSGFGSFGFQTLFSIQPLHNVPWFPSL